ncbi:MAG: MogA/MoaB family molybdenum cofactor biosynthesis protein [Phycisphaeraceae bacterium]|nr:MogA/MoaB family molybdenum cofactor biosynthesis protein [Phycisphaeraceae bacterium]
MLTISDTRSKSDDDSGRIIHELLQGAGHVVSDYRLVKDEPAQIEAQVKTWLAAGSFDAVCMTGGTGISSRDTTIEVVHRMLDRELPGFGELFRYLSWDQVESAAMLSRAIAGLAGETLIFVMPGSTNAVKLAMSKLIAPELAHLVWERKR